MRVIVEQVINKNEWMAELGFDQYTPAQQKTLWDLVFRALQTKAMDVLLDQLSQADQRHLVQYMSEDELSDQLQKFLDKKVPGYANLIQEELMEYKKQLKRNLNRLVRKPEEG